MIFKLQNYRTIGAAVGHLRDTRILPNVHHRILHNGPDTVDELLDRHLVKNDTKHLDDDENELLTRRRLTSTRREALSLYRDIIRATRFFMWPDSRGVLWRDVLRENARKEFEEARFERDPEVVTRLLIGGRDAVQAALDKLVEKQKQQIENERNDSHRR
ncbi:NADH:ubiquinone oxidoreductase, NDUFA6/B14 subunit [Handroanthus impetiginosus]|uniref:NADH:ubiquinone oxidoreductase, NDUFA6/B14 subunit n=1 Tax=Handroanthus impetiginosus TaxID=429701 RepID=A0A2G9HLX8_9LAMI|nr:NADH:ubiquinone oxidoreductase, NDUFA6/B14 subunit [Handroanthus impetiginosus]